MREVLTAIAARLGVAPENLAALTRHRAEASDALHRALEEARKIEVMVAGEVATATELGRPKFANEAARNAEVQRRLAENLTYRKHQEEIARLRRELRQLDADLELAKSRFRADNGIAFLAACLIQAGCKEDAKAVLAAYGEEAGAQAPPAQAPAQAGAAPQVQTQGQAQGLEMGTFEVLEVRTTPSGAVRAYCQAEDGSKVAVYGKNGTGQALSAAAGKRVQVKYRRGDKGLIAVDVRPVA